MGGVCPCCAGLSTLSLLTWMLLRSLGLDQYMVTDERISAAQSSQQALREGGRLELTPRKPRVFVES